MKRVGREWIYLWLRVMGGNCRRLEERTCVAMAFSVLIKFGHWTEQDRE